MYSPSDWKLVIFFLFKTHLHNLSEYKGDQFNALQVNNYVDNPTPHFSINRRQNRTGLFWKQPPFPKYRYVYIS